ncbi:hypothetical protein V8E54_005852 [Elaphomyces granulatus]
MSWKEIFLFLPAVSFPHWPPTSYEEAIEQLRCVLGKDIGHRRYLASCWLSFVKQKASSDSFYRLLAGLIETKCPTFLHEQRKEELEELRRQAQIKYCKVFSCSAFCNLVLAQQRRSCLCHCRRHRDERPAHSNQ